ncbi:MAG: zinc ribbon domain-containing protein [Deltaproteobacteria bacterium]|nr:zinc ribbon domain-containing protein [Deltaproteobacteria bacterium]
MPLYEYSCRDCGHRFEQLQALGAGAEGLSCPQCGAEHLEKVFSTFASTVAGGFGASSGAVGAMASGGCCRGTPT